MGDMRKLHHVYHDYCVELLREFYALRKLPQVTAIMLKQFRSTIVKKGRRAE